MYDVIIIGAGPAGLTAGFYCGRFRLNTLVLEKMSVGGQIILSPAIDNFPGFPQGIATIELMEKFKQQLSEVGVSVAMEEVVEIAADTKSQVPFYTLRTQAQSYQARALIIASGALPKKMGVKGEDRFIGKGVSYCGTCDAPFFKNKEIVIVGGGDRAMEEAIFLTNYASKVTLIHRRNEFRASQILVEKAKANLKINFIFASVIEEITGENRVNSIKVKNVLNGSLRAYPCQGVFIFVGITPNTGFLNNFLQLDEAKFIITDQAMKANALGVFACGDCVRKGLYQVINACGEGAVAADGAHKYLLNLKK